VDEYERRLHAAILRELGIAEPPFQLKVESYVGSVHVFLRDGREGLDAYNEGKPVWGLDLRECGENNIAEKAKEGFTQQNARFVTCSSLNLKSSIRTF
jgi:hypothetical protein